MSGGHDFKTNALAGLDNRTLPHACTHKLIARLAARSEETVTFTFAPRTPALTMMHAVGRFFPRSDRAPAFEPVDTGVLRQCLAAEPAVFSNGPRQSTHINTGLYLSPALEVVRP